MNHRARTGVCVCGERRAWMATRSHMLTVFDNQRSLIIPCRQLRGLFVSPPNPLAAAARLLPLPVCGSVTRTRRGSGQLSKTITAGRAPVGGVTQIQTWKGGRMGARVATGGARKKFIMDANQSAAIPFVPRRHACTA